VTSSPQYPVHNSIEVNFARNAEELARLGVDEIVPGKLYALGGMVKLDGRVSWAPSNATGYQPINCYVLLEDAAAMIVDPGPALHEALVVRQLRALLPKECEVQVFLTRSEFDCVGNLGGIALAFPIKQLFTSGSRNPFDSFEYATLGPALRGSRVKLERQPAGFQIPIAASRTFEIVVTQLRLLTTFWGYDSLTKTLFTSDAFSDATVEGAGHARVIDSTVVDNTTEQTARDHLHAKFWWLEHTDKKDQIRRNLREIFERHHVEVIAPGHGCVLRGESIVAEHYKRMLDVLGEG